MTELELRLECLKLAVAVCCGTPVLASAEAFYNWLHSAVCSAEEAAKSRGEHTAHPH